MTRMTTAQGKEVAIVNKKDEMIGSASRPGFAPGSNRIAENQEDRVGSRDAKPAAYVASSAWQFPEHLGPSPSPVPTLGTPSKAAQNSSKISNSDGSYRNTPRIQTPQLTTSVRIHESNVSSSMGATGESRLLTPNIVKIERSSITRSISVAAVNKNHDSSLPQQYAAPDSADYESDDCMDEGEFATWIAQQHQEETRRPSRSSAPKAKSRGKSSISLSRNPTIVYPFENLESYTFRDVRLSLKSFVELQDGDFMKIIHIIRDTSTSEVTIRGHIYRRTREMNGLLDRKLNEVCWILHIDDDDARDPLVQGIETVSVSEVVRRRSIRITNMAFPALSFRDEAKETEETIMHQRVLVCRYKYLCFYKNAKARDAYAWCEKGLHRIRANECDKRADNDIEDNDLRHDWRGTTVLGGAREGWLNGEREFLRQEAVSHRGFAGRQSLKAPDGSNFPIEEPMERANVGILLDKSDLSCELSVFAAPLSEQGIPNPNIPQPLGHNTSGRIPQQRQAQRPGPAPLATFDRSTTHSNLYNLYGESEETGMLNLTSSLRESSIEAPNTRQTSPEIIEIDAQIKTSSSAGIFKKRYEGRITSIFVPSNTSKRKRLTEDSAFGHMRPIKRSSTESPANQLEWPSDEKAIYSRGASSEATIADSQSDDSVEELWLPQKTGALKSSKSRFLNPCTPSTIFSNSHDTDMDDVIDLTAPHIFQSRFQIKTQQPPVICMSEVSDSRLGAPRSCLHASPAPQTFAQPVPARKHYASGLCRTPNAIPLQSRVDSPRFLHSSRLSSPNPFAEHSTPQLKRELQPKIERETSQTPFQDQGTRVEPGEMSPPNAKQRRYTFGDCFCGAGGMSRGALIAGLRIEWGFDFNQTACQTYAANFFGTPVYKVWANEFADSKADHIVDICHLSPPCQFFSDAHTIQGKDDDINTASLFAIFNLLEKAKPRVVTLEQTSGLIRRHPLFFNAVINMFTSRGFSVRWRVLNCADFGLAQRRLRLFIIASCPGEPLPPFPTPTHSAHPAATGLKPWTTINTAISSIPPTWPNHSPSASKLRFQAPISGDRIASCVTTSGGPGNIHPSGQRDYTHREFACLQGFPLGHKFRGNWIKKQIGNAVPPVVAALLLESVRRGLEVEDGVV